MMQIQQVEAAEAVKMEDSKMPIQKSQIDMMNHDENSERNEKRALGKSERARGK